MTTMRSRDGVTEGGDDRRLFPDRTFKRVPSPARCPVRACGHDNRSPLGTCPHFVARLESVEEVPLPGAGEHVIAQGYVDTPGLRSRYWVYREV